MLKALCTLPHALCAGHYKMLGVLSFTFSTNWQAYAKDEIEVLSICPRETAAGGWPFGPACSDTALSARVLFVADRQRQLFQPFHLRQMLPGFCFASSFTAFHQAASLSSISLLSSFCTLAHLRSCADILKHIIKEEGMREIRGKAGKLTSRKCRKEQRA